MDGSITHGNPADACWIDERDRLLIEASDALHDNADLDDDSGFGFGRTFPMNSCSIC